MESLVDGRQIYPIGVKVIANPLPQPIVVGVIRLTQSFQQLQVIPHSMAKGGRAGPFGLQAVGHPALRKRVGG
jgi:hypothetical protein